MSLVSVAVRHATDGDPVFKIRRGTKDKPQADWANGGAVVSSLDAFDTFAGRPVNLGVRTDRLVVVDVDGHREGFETLAAHPEMPPTYTVRTPNGGLHLYYRAPAGLELAGGVNRLGQGVDIKTGPRSYVVGAGSAFGEREYTLERDAAIEECPTWLVTHLAASARKVSDAPKVVGELDTPSAIDSARSYLEYSAPLAVEGCGGNECTYKVACAVKDRGVSEEQALELLLEIWNERCSPAWEQADLAAIVSNAYQYGTAAVGRDNPAAGFVPITLPAPQNSTQETSYWVGDAASDEDVLWLIDEAIQRGGIGFMPGPSGSCKTFQIVHMAMCGATGTPFFGRKISERFGTYIVAAEGGHSIRQRVRAAANHAFGSCSGAADLPIKFTKGAPDLMSRSGRAAFIEDLHRADLEMRRKYGVGLGLIVFDTFAQTFPIRDENASTEVTRATKIMQECSEATGATSMATHHFGHTTERARGSSAFRANVDFNIEMRKDGEVFLEKCRDAREGIALGWFECPVVQLGTKKDGRPITSRYVRELPHPRGKAPDPSAGFTSIQSGRDFEDAFAKVTDGDAKAVEAAFVAARSGKPDSRRKAWARALKKALATGYVLAGGKFSKSGPDIPDMSGF